MRIASDRARAANVAITFREGNASALPFADQSFDYVVCGAAFKNFTDPLGASTRLIACSCPLAAR